MPARFPPHLCPQIKPVFYSLLSVRKRQGSTCQQAQTERSGFLSGSHRSVLPSPMRGSGPLTPPTPSGQTSIYRRNPVSAPQPPIPSTESGESREAPMGGSRTSKQKMERSWWGEGGKHVLMCGRSAWGKRGTDPPASAGDTGSIPGPGISHMLQGD